MKNDPFVKLILARGVKYLQLSTLVALLLSAGFWMGEKGLTQKYQLEEKRGLLKTENEQLISEIKTLERRVTLLRSDPRTIEKAAKRKLGMALTDETVYIFPRAVSRGPAADVSGDGLGLEPNIP